VLSRFADAIMIPHRSSPEGGRTGAICFRPVINGLTDLSHPCQLLADMLTVIEKRSKLAGSRWAWLGDGNMSAIHSSKRHR
jgi:ornithine carbamoyltransferase